jgi:LmbE family N-acetylglucosaminyl deacetylase
VSSADDAPDMPYAPIASLGTILSVWAHPDDETYLAGGVMAAARDLGQRVVCVSATAGELGTADPIAWPPDRLARVRTWEASAAMAVLGIGEHHVLGFPDGGLASCEADGIAATRRLIADVDPDTILTFGPEGMTFHPDHIAVHRWVTRAWSQAGRRQRLLYATSTHDHLDRFGELYERWNVYMTDARPVGVRHEGLAVSVALRDAELDRKLVALRAMATQTGDVTAVLDPHLYAEMVAEEAFVEAPIDADGQRPGPSSNDVIVALIPAAS